MSWGDFLPPSPHSKVRLDRPCVLPRSARGLRAAAPQGHWQPTRGAVGAARFLHAVRPMPQSCNRLPAVQDSRARAPHLQAPETRQ